MKKSKTVTIKLTEEQLSMVLLHLECSASEVYWAPGKVELYALLSAILKQLGKRCL